MRLGIVFQATSTQGDMVMADSSLIRLSGLWAHEQDDGSLVLTGNLGGGARVVVLPIRDKGSSNKQPDYVLYLGSGDGKERGVGRKQGNRGSGLLRGH